MNVRSLMNLQLAIIGDDLYIIEVNPRAATFVSKAIGISLPKLASGQRPNVSDLIKNKDMPLVINHTSAPLLCRIASRS